MFVLINSKSKLFNQLFQTFSNYHNILDKETTKYKIKYLELWRKRNLN